MNLLNQLTPLAKPQPQVSHRILPSQPQGLPPGRIFAGVDLGLVEFDGPTPQPGDLVVILKQGGTTFCRSEQAVKGFTAPTFSSPCSCKCPGNAGVALYLAFPGFVTNVIAVDTVTGTVSQIFGRGELAYGIAGAAFNLPGSLAVDPVSPFNVYILEDRRPYTTLQTDSSPLVTRHYLGVATYAITAGQYQFSRIDMIADPYTRGSQSDPIQPSPEPDPPAFPGNCLSVVAGIPLITMNNAPAHYLALVGGAFIPHTLTQNNAPSSFQLRGNIVTVPDSPANKNNRYVIGFDGSTYSVLQFNAGNAITKVVPLTSTAPAVPKALASVCNRLLVLNAFLDTFLSNQLIEG